MNYSTAVFLINKDVRAVMATYEPDCTPSVFKTLDQDIKVDDLVIVPTKTRHNMTVCKVTDVDVDIDFDASPTVEWVIGVVDRSDYDRVLREEASAVKAIKSAELRKKRDDLREALFADHVETLKALPIAAINGDGEAEQTD